MSILLFIYLLSLVCWLGSIIFFSFFTVPVVFTRLPIVEAGKVISGIFPRYYLVGEIAGAIAVLLALYFTIANTPRRWWSGAFLSLAIALGLTLYAGLSIRPRVDEIRSVAEVENPDPARKAEFDRLHKLSVMINGGVMILDLFALYGTAAALSYRG